MFFRYKKVVDQSNKINVTPVSNDATNAELLKELREIRRELKAVKEEASKERTKIKNALKNIIRGSQHYARSNGIPDIDKSICEAHYNNAYDDLI